ncbi:MAG TPA: hypothetical protein VI389_05435 [Geobacteraceae bacterium]
MTETTIALIAAMPDETKPLLRRLGSYKTEKVGSFPCYRFALAGKTCCLVESGMGPRRAAAATRAVLAAASPRLVINFGFAGAVTAGPSTGDIVVAERILCCHERLFTEEGGISETLTDTLVSALATPGEKPFSLFRGTFVTTIEIASKKEVAQRLPAGTTYPSLEMETASVARITMEAQVPLVALRAISDDAAEELGFAIAEFTDNEMNLRLGKILLTVIRKPWIIPQLLRLARNTRKAGKNLAEAVQAAISVL